MRRGKLVKIKIGDKLLTCGLATLAVLFAVADGAGQFLLNFPDHRTTLNKALRNISKSNPKSAKEYFEELKEISGLNLRNIVSRLKQKGLVRKVDKGYELTAKGWLAAKNAENAINPLIRRNSEWDGKWRLITFDIPEKRRQDRDWLRELLKIADYKKLQKSVFVGKHPVSEAFYREIYSRKLNNMVRILTIGEIDIDL